MRRILEQKERAFDAAIDAMQVMIDWLRGDAERYRFLRDDFSAVNLNIDGNCTWAYKRNHSLYGTSLDGAIDKAIQARGDKT